MSTTAKINDLQLRMSESYRKQEELERAAPKGFRGFAKELFNDASLADIDILLDNDDPERNQKAGPSTKAFHGHRIVLVTMSDYLRTMLLSEEPNKREIRLKDVSYTMFEHCMRFAYCGWDEQLGKLTLDDALKFYGMVRMLLMESKVKKLFCGWMKEKLGGWESELWRIVRFGFENDMDPLVESCIEYFANIANCGLQLDGFNEVPLAIVQKIIAKKVMCCSKEELEGAITGWVNANKAKLSEQDEQKLFEDIGKLPSLCYRGRRVILYKHHETPKQKKPKLDAENPVKEPPPALLDTPTEYSYTSNMDFSKCMTLFGMTVVFKSNLDYGPKYGKVKTVLNIDFTIAEKRYNNPPVLCSRKVRVDCDFTRHSKLSRTIFFQPIEICAGTDIVVTIKWTEPGVQPLLHHYDSTGHKYVSMRNSHVTAILCHNVSDNCANCQRDSDDDSDSDGRPGCYW